MLINIVATIVITPTIIVLDKFLNRLRQSDCCGGHLELDPSRSMRRASQDGLRPNVSRRSPSPLEISNPTDMVRTYGMGHLTI